MSSKNDKKSITRDLLVLDQQAVYNPAHMVEEQLSDIESAAAGLIDSAQSTLYAISNVLLPSKRLALVFKSSSEKVIVSLVALGNPKMRTLFSVKRESIGWVRSKSADPVVPGMSELIESPVPILKVISGKLDSLPDHFRIGLPWAEHAMWINGAIDESEDSTMGRVYDI